MDLQFSDEHRAFQTEVREFIADNLPNDIQEKVGRNLKLQKDDYVRWQKILHEKGWIAPLTISAV